MITTEIDLKKFCDPERPALVRPFTHGEFTYATNGRVLVRVAKCDNEPNLPGVPTMESAESVLYVVGIVTEWQPLSVEIPPMRYNDCPDCKGFGKFDKCHDCSGEGVIECCSCGHEKNCRSCKGEGVFPSSNGKTACKDCDGKGKVEDPPSVQLGYDHVCSKYLALIAELPNVVIAPNVHGHIRQIPFKFNGGIGAIMPRTRPN